jgi:cytochrome c556
MKVNFRNFIFATLAAGIFSLGLTQVASADGHEIKYRKGVMKAIGGTMGSLAAVLKQQAPKEHAVPLALTMRNLASIAPDIFPASSDFGETAALPKIWEKPADFKKAVDAFMLAASILPDAAAAGGEDYKVAFMALGKSCKGCHESFRKKKEN